MERRAEYHRRLREEQTPELVAEFREWLDAYAAEAEQIEELRMHLATVRSWSTKTTSTWSDTPKPPSASDRRMERNVSTLMSAEAKLERAIKSHKQMEAAISQTIDALQSPKHQRILRLRYLQFKEWRDIVAEAYQDRPDYSEKLPAYTRRVYRDHVRAMKLAALEWAKIHI